MSMVSLFPKIKATTGGQQLPLSEVLAGIAEGRWAECVAKVRAATSKTEYRLLKNESPYFTVSGSFGERCDAGLLQHSGFVALDLDDSTNPTLNVVTDKARLAADPYTYACFTSIGGKGLCCLIRIPITDHLGSWYSLAAYYLQRYGLKADDACKDVSRPRFVSYDPDLYFNEASEVWQDVADAPKPKASPPPRSSEHQAPPPPRGEGYGPSAISRAVEKILSAGEGQKHYVLNKMAFLLGGVAASGFITEEEARQALQDAIGRREVADLKQAYRTIEDGLAAGRLKPALPYDLHYRVHNQLRDGISPEMIGAGIAASEGLPAGNITAAAEDIAAEKRNEVHLLTFWDLVESGTKRDAPLKLVLSLTKFGKWLGENGFRQRSLGEKTQLVQLDGHIVRPIVRSGLKAFVLDYIEELPFTFDGIYRSQLEEQVRRQHVSLFDQAGWEFLPFLREDFLRDTATSSRKCYLDCWVEVTAQGLHPRPYAELPGLVWASEVIQRPFPLLPTDEVEQAEYFTYLWHLAAHKEPRLQAELLLTGYYLHTYKDPSTPRIGVLVDELAAGDGQANGGTGKSLFFKALNQLVEVVEVDGKGYDPRNAKALQQVSDATRVIFFNDWDTQRVPFDRLFNMATDTLTVDRLYSGQQSYPFEVSPKIGMTTNGILTGKDQSQNRRKFELEIAPHYGPGHQPRDEFGHNFFSGWSPQEWARFDNLMLYAIHLYLKTGSRLVGTVSENMERRRLVAGTSPGFVDFMDAQPRGAKLYRTQLLTEFRVAEGYDEKAFTPERFSRWLGQYKELANDFQQGQDSAGDTRKMRWIMLAKDSKTGHEA